MQQEIYGPFQDIPKQLSLKATDVLFIASDVTQLALDARKVGVAFNANSFIEAFQDQLTNGTILIPAYTDNLKDGDVFNHIKSKPTTGALSNKVMRRKDFLRSKDPLHSVFVWGKGTQEILNRDGDSSLGAGSIFEWMYQNDAKMLCIDVHFQNSLTYVHYVEELKRVAYRKPYNWSIKRIFQDGSDEKKIVFYSRKPWVLTDLDLLQKKAIEKGVATEIIFGNTRMLLFEIKEMHNLIEDMLDTGEKLHRISLLHFSKGIAKRMLGRA